MDLLFFEDEDYYVKTFSIINDDLFCQKNLARRAKLKSENSLLKILQRSGLIFLYH